MLKQGSPDKLWEAGAHGEVRTALIQDLVNVSEAGRPGPTGVGGKVQAVWAALYTRPA